VIVVDASILAAFLLGEPGWRRLVEHLKHSVILDLAVKEAVNALWKACVLENMVSEEQVLELYKLLSSMIGLNIAVEPEEKYMEEALKIALEHGATICDTLYIALAKRRNTPLLTLDMRQAEASRKLGVPVIIPETRMQS
jgi:predicted nucleic acid-binding protein